MGIFSLDAANTLVAVSMVSIVLNPILYRTAPRLARWTSSTAPSRPAPAPAPVDPRGRAVVIGHGPTGRNVTRLLRENGIEPTVVDMNIDTVRQLRQEGVNAVYGDATLQDTLEAAGVARAGSLILTSAGMERSAETIRVARSLNPHIHVLGRAGYLREIPQLRRAGADSVVTGEGEVALALTEAILQRLGATPEQMDRERRRARTELFGDEPTAD
jgi:CPA2 family monovalent cation:H+ antiporter-2